MSLEDDVCVWYKSESITKDNPMFDCCRKICGGKDYSCLKYQPRKLPDFLMSNYDEGEIGI